MVDCLFCKIIDGQVPAKVVFENDFVIAFHDINPLAPVHILVLPKIHVESALTMDPNLVGCIKDMMLVAQQIAQDNGIENCARLVMNNGARAGQSVFHLHMHLIGGRDFTWPPG
ncbi:MAG: histidine triad nucleotide-binding protein [Myxococcota bacterium]